MFKFLLDQLLSSPAGRKQAGYKKRSKEKGLMSLETLLSKAKETGYLNLEEFEALMDEAKSQGNPEIVTQLFTKNRTKLCLDSFAKVELSGEADENGIVTLEKKVIYQDGVNWHGLELGLELVTEMVEKFNKESDESEDKVLNANHSRYPEDAIGYYSTLEIEDDKVLATVSIDVNHPSFASQKYALSKGDVDLGFSIELTFDDIILSLKTWKLKYVDPHLVGLATTLIPSAPGTLSKLDSTESPEVNAEVPVVSVLSVSDAVGTPEIGGLENIHMEIEEVKKTLSEGMNNLKAEYELELKTIKEYFDSELTKIDESQKTINNELSQATQELADMTIRTLSNQNSTLEAQNQLLNKINNLKTSISTL